MVCIHSVDLDCSTGVPTLGPNSSIALSHATDLDTIELLNNPFVPISAGTIGSPPVDSGINPTLESESFNCHSLLAIRVDPPLTFIMV